jgi:F1F0 ATPase subunit 2
MNVVIAALGPFFGGMGLGVLFFGGLWLTVRRGLASGRAGLWFAASSLLRTAVALIGMYWLTGGRWQALLPCVAGFYLARVAVTRFAGAPLAPAPVAEDSHAS